MFFDSTARGVRIAIDLSLFFSDLFRGRCLRVMMTKRRKKSKMTFEQSITK
jgi:hypothetical protein